MTKSTTLWILVSFAVLCLASVQVQNEGTEEKMCIACNEFVKVVDFFYKRGESEEQIKHKIGEFCKIMPTNISSECTLLTDKYLPLMINYLEKKVDPKKICQLLNLCSSSEEKDAPIIYFFLCIECEIYVYMVEQVLKHFYNFSVVKEMMDQDCEKLPFKFLKKGCLKFVDGYLQEIIMYITDKYPARKVCTLIGYCRNNTEIEEKRSKEIMIGLIDNLLEMNYSKEEITDIICSLYSSVDSDDKQQECNNLITEYLEKVPIDSKKD